MSDTRDDIVAVVHGYGGNEHANPDYVMAEEIVRLRAALAARTREVKEMRADLRIIANAYDDGISTGGLAARCYDMACVARRALAAQEGTR